MCGSCPIIETTYSRSSIPSRLTYSDPFETAWPESQSDHIDSAYSRKKNEDPTIESNVDDFD